MFFVFLFFSSFLTTSSVTEQAADGVLGGGFCFSFLTTSSMTEQAANGVSWEVGFVFRF